MVKFIFTCLQFSSRQSKQKSQAKLKTGKAASHDAQGWSVQSYGSRLQNELFGSLVPVRKAHMSQWKHTAKTVISILANTGHAILPSANSVSWQ